MLQRLNPFRGGPVHGLNGDIGATAAVLETRHARRFAVRAMGTRPLAVGPAGDERSPGSPPLSLRFSSRFSVER
jgi:hypothetical protein